MKKITTPFMMILTILSFSQTPFIDSNFQNAIDITSSDFYLSKNGGSLEFILKYQF